MKQAMNNAHERFEEELREWGSRPSPTSAHRAAREVCQRIAEPRRGFASLAFRSAAGALAAGLIAALGWWLVLSREETGPTLPAAPSPVPTVVELAPAPLAEGVVLIWLDSETPLYMTFAAPRPDQGPASRSPKGDAS